MRCQAGFAMIWAMFLVIAVGSLSFLVLERDRTMRRDARTDGAALSAFHAAEGGIQHARHALGTNGAWTGTTLRVGRCEVEVVVTPLEDGAWRVRSRAEPGAGRVVAVLRPSDGLPLLEDWQQD